jgi:hypothetical protein
LNQKAAAYSIPRLRGGRQPVFLSDTFDYVFAGHHLRVTLLNALPITGQNSSTIASVVIEPTRIMTRLARSPASKKLPE